MKEFLRKWAAEAVIKLMPVIAKKIAEKIKGK